MSEPTLPSPQLLQIKGTLSLDNVAELLALGQQKLSQGDVIVDFAAVGSVDSAALALIFAWQRFARDKGRNLLVHDVPADLTNLARLYGVDTLLPEIACTLPQP